MSLLNTCFVSEFKSLQILYPSSNSKSYLIFVCFVIGKMRLAYIYWINNAEYYNEKWVGALFKLLLLFHTSKQFVSTDTKCFHK